MKTRRVACCGSLHTAGHTRPSLLLFLILLALASGCTGSPAATVPASSESVPSPRIICLSSDAAELLVIIGAGDHVIGVPDSLIRHQPELFRQLPNAVSVGDAKKPDNERILALKPDIVLFISAMRPATAGIWEKAGIRTLPMESHKAEDLPEVARSLGQLTGHSERAEQYAVFCEKTLAMVSGRLGPVSGTPLRVYPESYTDYVAYGNISAAHTLLATLKTESIPGMVFSNATRVSPEWIVRENPDVIIKSIVPDAEKTLEGEHARIIARDGFGGIRAVREGRVYVISGNLIFSPHAPVGTVFLAKALYPEAFADVDPDEILRQYAGTFMPGVDHEPTMYPIPWSANRTGGSPP
jgi:iron complex transport system substrate-binding protein